MKREKNIREIITKVVNLVGAPETEIRDAMIALNMIFDENVSPYKELVPIGSGSYKIAFKLHPEAQWVIKFALDSNPTPLENAVLKDAAQCGVSELFVPTFSYRILDSYPRVDEDDDLDWDFEDLDEPFTYLIVQPEVVTNIDAFGDIPRLKMDKYDYSGNPIQFENGEYLSIDAYVGMLCPDYNWLKEVIYAYGDEKAAEMFAFLLNNEVHDLSDSNIGFWRGKPVILDWLSSGKYNAPRGGNWTPLRVMS